MLAHEPLDRREVHVEAVPRHDRAHRAAVDLGRLQERRDVLEVALEADRPDELDDPQLVVAGVPEGVRDPARLGHELARAGEAHRVPDLDAEAPGDDVGVLVLARVGVQRRAEKAAETRRRIVEATVALHEEVGPARTTVAEVARRAGVQRLTVYNHFPDERDLLAACQAHFLAGHPPPDFEELLAAEDPVDRLRAVLEALYGFYRQTEPMSANVRRDAQVVPALAEVMAGEAAMREQLVDGLARGLGRSARVRAALAVALDFGTWQILACQGLGDAAAADVMVAAVRAAGGALS